MQFEKIAPYLKDPLVLIGFFLFLGFLFCRYVIKQGIVPALPPTLGFRVLRTILLYGFILGLLICGLGFYLKYQEIRSEERTRAQQTAEQKRKDDAEIADRLHQEELARQRDLAEQQAQISRLSVELNRNLGVADQLRKNTIVMITEFKTLTEVVREPGIEILTILFPAKNLDLAIPDSKTTTFADDAMDQLRDSGLLANQLEMQKITAAAHLIFETIQATRSTVKSLQDPDRKRYVFSNNVWVSERTNIEKVVATDLSPYQTSYGNLELLRANYDVVTQHFIEYLADLESFFDPVKHQITREGLRQILIKERYTDGLLLTYGKELADQMAQLKSLNERLHKPDDRPTSTARATADILCDGTHRCLSERCACAQSASSGLRLPFVTMRSSLQFVGMGDDNPCAVTTRHQIVRCGHSNRKFKNQGTLAVNIPQCEGAKPFPAVYLLN